MQRGDEAVIEFASNDGVFTAGVDRHVVRRIASHAVLDAASSPDGRRPAYLRRRDHLSDDLVVTNAV